MKLFEKKKEKKKTSSISGMHIDTLSSRLQTGSPGPSQHGRSLGPRRNSVGILCE